MTLLELDSRLTGWLYLSLPESTGKLLFVAAGALIYLLPLLLIVLFFRSIRDRLVSIKITLAVIFAWQVLSKLIGTVLYTNYGFRDRPFFTRGGQTELFFEQPEKAFPSDHAAVFAATATILYGMGYKKAGHAALVIGLVSTMSRVMIGFHWFGDIVGGVIVGIIAGLVILMFNQRIDRIILVVQGWFSRKNERKKIA